MITVLDNLEQLPSSGQEHVLTIGTFDGVHLGHQAVIRRAIALGADHNLPTAALTFSNHPGTVLRPETSPPLLCAPPYRYSFMQKQGLSWVIALAFTAELSKLSAQEFLKLVKDRVPFTHLVLGHDATLGKSREGGRAIIEKLAKELDFQVEYLPALKLHDKQISSSLIRDAVRHGRLEEAAQWLGRAYSLAGYIVPGLGHGRKLGFPTLNIDVSRLCLPPLGVYAVELRSNGNRYPGIANLGHAPTVRVGGPPILEVHLFSEPNTKLAGMVEVVIDAFVRPEKKFASIDQLKDQIAADIASVKAKACSR